MPVALAVGVAEGLAVTDDCVTSGAIVEVGEAVAVGLAVGLGFTVAAAKELQTDILVVQAAPATGQQYFVVAEPQVSTLPALSQRDSTTVPSVSAGWQLLSKLVSPE